MVTGLIQVLSHPNYDPKRSALVQRHDVDAFCLEICSPKIGLLPGLLALLWTPGERFPPVKIGFSVLLQLLSRIRGEVFWDVCNHTSPRRFWLVTPPPLGVLNYSRLFQTCSRFRKIQIWTSFVCQKFLEASAEPSRFFC